jgi:hypothetical protein
MTGGRSTRSVLRQRGVGRIGVGPSLGGGGGAVSTLRFGSGGAVNVARLGSFDGACG